MSRPVGDPTPEESGRMREDLMGFIARSKRRRTVRRRIAGAAAVVAAGAIATAWIVIAPLEVRERNVECFSAADLEAPSSGAMLVDAEVDDPLGVALSNCVALWEVGLVGDVPDDEPKDGSVIYPVPELTACLRPDQTFVVFPSSPVQGGPVESTPGDRGRDSAQRDRLQPDDAADFCAELGLTAP